MTHKIKTYESACKALKLNPKNLPVVSKLPKKHKDAIIAHYKLVIIVEALNEGWEPNWSNYDEYKYHPWFEYKNSGAVFGGVGSYYYSADVGSRLVFKSRDLAEYAARHFIKLYNTYLTLLK